MLAGDAHPCRRARWPMCMYMRIYETDFHPLPRLFEIVIQSNTRAVRGHRSLWRISVHDFVTIGNRCQPSRIRRDSPAFSSDVPRSREISRCPAFFENGIIIFFVADYSTLAGYPALLGPLPLYFSLPIRYSFLPSLPRITRLRPEYLQCNNRRG